MSDTTQPNLLQELRDAASVPRDVPLVLFGLPRWAALGLSRLRATELGTRLVQQHADSLRQKPDGNPHVVLWLPINEHQFKGVHVLCHEGFEAGTVMGWADWKPLMWPRSFSEYPAALLPWQSSWTGLVERHGMANTQARDIENLVREAVAMTRQTPAVVQPSPALMAVIMQHDAGEAVEPVAEEEAE